MEVKSIIERGEDMRTCGNGTSSAATLCGKGEHLGVKSDRGNLDARCIAISLHGVDKGTMGNGQRRLCVFPPQRAGSAA